VVFETLIRKYVRVKSATFWIGLVPLIGGIIELVDAFTPMGYASTLSYALFGDASPFMLILTGAGTITMRAAINPMGHLR